MIEQQLQSLLQVSAKLFEQLSVVPEGTQRDSLIVQITEKLEQREQLIATLKANNFQYDESNKMHQMLFELDKGIRARLSLHLNSIKSDLRDLQLAKKKEKNYVNPYSDVRAMDGKYYDRKK